MSNQYHISLKEGRPMSDGHLYASSVGKQSSHSRVARRLHGYGTMKESSETKEDEQTRKRYLSLP